MTKAEICGKWTRACAAVELKGRFVRNGNWVEPAFALRHKDCASATVTVVEQEGSTILKIEPASTRPAFHLIVI